MSALARIARILVSLPFLVVALLAVLGWFMTPTAIAGSPRTKGTWPSPFPRLAMT